MYWFVDSVANEPIPIDWKIRLSLVAFRRKIKLSLVEFRRKIRLSLVVFHTTKQ